MPAREYLICAGADLAEGGAGVRFAVPWRGEQAAAFAVRYGGQVRAYLNRCAHVGVELDWEPGRFFDAEGRYLLCATHGATYRPQDGACIYGPCKGRALTPLAAVEREGKVFIAIEETT